MEYARLGRSGLELSRLSFGSWVTFGFQLDDAAAMRCLAAAHDTGINFFDNAEVYAGGESERIMGRVLRNSHGRATRSAYRARCTGVATCRRSEACTATTSTTRATRHSTGSRSTTSTCSSAIVPTSRRRSRRPCARSTCWCGRGRSCTGACLHQHSSRSAGDSAFARSSICFTICSLRMDWSTIVPSLPTSTVSGTPETR